MTDKTIAALTAAPTVSGATLFEIEHDAISYRATAAQIAAYIIAQVSDSAPALLDTLNELAAAIGDDPNFAVTISNALAGKQPLDADLTAIAALATQAFGRSLLTSVDAAAALALTGGAPLASPAFTGLPTAPTAATGTNTTQLATTSFVAAALAALVNASPAQLDTLKELADALGNDASFAATMTAALAGKQPLDADLTAIAALATQAFGRSLLTMTDDAAVRAALSVTRTMVLQSAAPSPPLTGTTAETTLATIALPANAIGPNGNVEIYALVSFTGSTNGKTLRVKFGGTTYYLQTLSGNTVIGLQSYSRISNRNSASSQVGGLGTASGLGALSSIVTSSENTAAPVNITISGQLATGSETMTLEGYLVRATYGA